MSSCTSWKSWHFGFSSGAGDDRAVDIFDCDVLEYESPYSDGLSGDIYVVAWAGYDFES